MRQLKVNFLAFYVKCCYKIAKIPIEKNILILRALYHRVNSFVNRTD